jgi:hypothetical protein
MTSAINQMMLFGYPNGNDQFTKILLHFDGADGSTTITNSAAGGTSTIIVGGNTQIDTAQSKFGGSSALFDGNDTMAGNGTADAAFGTGAFTVDFWVRFNSVAAAQLLYDSRPNATQGVYPTIYMNGSQKIIFLQDNADRITGTTSMTTGAWFHIAVARQGTSTKLFINGTQEGSTYSDSNNYLNGASRPAIGCNGNSASNELNGWLDEVRVSKGVARWTSNFTPWGKAYG